MTPSADCDLLQAYLDGTLAPGEVRALEARLRTEPALADVLIALAHDEAILTEWAHCASAGTATEEAPLRLVPRLQAARRWLPRRLVAVISGAAALLAVTLLGGYLAGWWHKETPRDLALLEDVQGEVYIVPESGDEFLAHSGQALALGNGLRTHGDGSSVVVSFPDASRLEVGPDTTIRLNSLTAPRPGGAGRKVFLEQGTVAADVAKQPTDRPMTLTTPQAEARFLEMKSSFASAAGQTRIELEKGNAQVTRKSDGRSIQVPTGWYVIASATEDFARHQLPPQLPEPRAVIKEGSGAILSAAYAPDGGTLAIGCWDGTIKFHHPTTGELQKTLRGHKRPVKALAFSPNGGLLASANDEKMVKLWDSATGLELASLKGYKGGIESLAFSRDGAFLATGGGYGKASPEVRIWDPVTRQEVAVLQGEHANHVTAVAFALDGKTLATGGKDKLIKLWDVPTRLTRHTLEGHADRVNALTFATDGKTLISAGKDRTVRLWDLPTAKERRSLPGHSGDVRALALSKDGKRLASADGNLLHVWDLASYQERLTFKGPKNTIFAVAFAPNGKELATVGSDRLVRFWDANSKEEKKTLPVKPR